MSRHSPDVKPRRVTVLVLVERCRSFVDHHPRTGWYIAMVATANLILQLAQIIGH